MQKAAYDFDALFAQKPKPRIRPTKVEFVGMPGADLFPKDRIANCFDAQLDDPVNVAGALVMSRSEEHTSELQSLMRISYAVFCLKKKRMQINHANTAYHIKTKPL